MAERRHQLIYWLLPPALLLAGCGVLPTSEPLPPPQTPAEDYRTVATEHRDRVMNPATASLIEQGRALQRAGRPLQAAAALERALRIDPNEPAVWLELAELRYAAANWQDAEQFARRARSLAPANSALEVSDKSWSSHSGSFSVISSVMDREAPSLSGRICFLFRSCCFKFRFLPALSITLRLLSRSSLAS